MAEVIVSFTINAHCYDAVMGDIEFHEQQGDLRNLSILPQEPFQLPSRQIPLSPPSPMSLPMPRITPSPPPVRLPMSLAAVINTGPPRPVSPPWIAPRRILPRRTVYLDQECTICREDSDDDVRILQCGHVFCTACIRRWYRVRQAGPKKCPTCQAPFLRKHVY